MRELVTGGANCNQSSSSLNPLGALANALIGSSSQKERLQEIPTSTLNTSGNNLYSGAREPLSALPGSDLEHPPQHHNSGFVNGFHAANDNRLSEVWDGIQNPQSPHFHSGHPQHQPELNGPPQRVLSSFLHSFVNSSHGGVPFGPTQLPLLACWGCPKEINGAYVTVVALWLGIFLLTSLRISSMARFGFVRSCIMGCSWAVVQYKRWLCTNFLHVHR